MDSISSLSDSELRSQLLSYGVTVGPVTPTTRNVYCKKLAKVLAGEFSQDETSFQQTTVTKEEFEDEEVDFTQVTDFQQQKEIGEELVEVSLKTPKAHICKSIINDGYSSQTSPLPYSRHYEPVDDTLRRRPFYTPGGSRFQPSPLTVPTTTTTVTAKSVERKRVVPAKMKKVTLPPPASWKWCRVFFIFILLAALLILIVYYHMESNNYITLPKEN